MLPCQVGNLTESMTMYRMRDQIARLVGMGTFLSMARQRQITTTMGVKRAASAQVVVQNCGTLEAIRFSSVIREGNETELATGF